MTPQLNAWIYTIGWALIHFVWQGGLIALATAAALASCRHRSSETRYAIACAGLVAMLAAPAITAAVVGTSDQTIAPGGSASPTVSTSASPSPAPATARLQTASLSLAATAARTASTVERWLPIVVWVWLSGVMLLLARFAGASFRVRRLRLASLKEPLSPWQSTGERLAAQLRLDVGFRIVESALVDAPSVIGTMRPIIFLPVTALTGLTPHQIEALIAHELAHIRRRDYAVNIAQTVAEALLFFHPAVWWISARIRQEREHCCDDVAVETCGEPVDYAAALAELAAWRSRDLALSVGAADGPLLARVRRVLRAPSEDAPRSSGGLAVLALGLLVSPGPSCTTASQKPPAPASRVDRANDPGQNQILRGNVEPQKDGPLRGLLPAGPGPARRTCRPGGRTRVRAGQRRLAAQPGVSRADLLVPHDDRVRRQRTRRRVSGRSRRAVLRRSHPARDRPAGGPVARTHHPRGRARLCIRHPSGAIDGDMGHGRSGRVRARRLGSQRSVGAAKRGARQCRPGAEPAAG